MKDETSLVNEIRVKLHIKSNLDSQIKNLWMCLNYDQKPSVSHIVEHIKRNFCQHDKRAQRKLAELNEEAEPDVKLYLDDFWLPPYENSRLIRENDCVKVELNFDQQEQTYPPESNYASKLSKKNWGAVKGHETNNKPIEANKNKQNGYENYGDDQIDQDDNQYYGNEHEDFYYHYYDNNDEEEEYSRPSNARYNQQYQQRATESFDPFEFWTSNPQTNETKEKPQAKVNTNTFTKPQPQKETKSNPLNNKKQSQKSPQETAKTTSSKPTKPVATNCYKKFAVGSYAHLLNEQPTEQKATNQNKGANQAVKQNKEFYEEEARANYYMQQAPKKLNDNDENVDFNKIASNVNSTGRQKWKNSTQQTKSNGPKHIIFPSTDSDSSSSSSSSSSSDSSDSETEIKKKPFQNQTVTAKKESISTALKNVSKGKKTFYEPTKDEQLNAANTNRSYTVQNTKSLSEFKKVFNETKLNAPKAEEFAKQNNQTTKPKLDKKQAPAKADQLNASLDSSTCSSTSSASSSSSSPNKKGRKSPSSPKIEYEKLTKLEGMPRLEDKVAFQILEISSNFTPEISAYKTGTVIDIDDATNEITIRLNNKYNAVLKKPSKFSVVFDETEEETLEANENEPVKIKRQTSQENDNLLKVDWRNLMNLKLLPEETKKETDKPDLHKVTEQHQMAVAN